MAGRTREDPAEQEHWRMAWEGPEGQTRPALACQEARGELAAWQAARVGPAGQEAWVAPAGRGTWEAPAGLEALVAPAGRGAWEAPAGRGAWAAPAGRGAWAAPAGRGAWAARGAWATQGWPPGQQTALERPPGLEGEKKPSSSSSSSSASESGMPQPLRPPLGVLELHRPQLGALQLHPTLLRALQLLWPPLERALWAPGLEQALEQPPGRQRAPGRPPRLPLEVLQPPSLGNESGTPQTPKTEGDPAPSSSTSWGAHRGHCWTCPSVPHGWTPTPLLYRWTSGQMSLCQYPADGGSAGPWTGGCPRRGGWIVWRLMMAGTSPSSAGSSSWWVRSVKDGVNGRERRPNRWRKIGFY